MGWTSHFLEIMKLSSVHISEMHCYTVIHRDLQTEPMQVFRLGNNTVLHVYVSIKINTFLVHIPRTLFPVSDTCTAIGNSC